MKPKFYSKLVNRQPNMKASYFWFMMGTGISAVSSLFILMAVNRISGEFEAGVFSIGFATAQLMWSIGSFDTMTYQVTDVRNRFSFSDYHGFKLLLCLLMMVASVIDIYIIEKDIYLVDGLNSSKAKIALALCLFRAIDAFSNLFMSALQKEDRLDLGGMSFFIRILLSYGALIGSLAVTKDLLVSVLVGSAVSLLWVLCIEMPVTSAFIKLKPRFRLTNLKNLFLACFPLFLGLFVLNYIFNAPKYAIDKNFTENIQTYFNIIFVPASIINLLCAFIFKPLLTKLAHYWDKKEKKGFVSITFKLCLLIFGLTIVMLIGGYFLGTQLLSLFYGADVTPYKDALMVVLIGGGCYALVSMFCNILIVMRKQNLLLGGYVFSAISTYFIAPVLVKNYEIMGASLSFLVSMLLVFLFIFTIYLYSLKNFGESKGWKRK